MTGIKFLIGSQGENIFLALQQEHRIMTVVYHPTDHWILAVQKRYFFNPTLHRYPLSVSPSQQQSQYCVSYSRVFRKQSQQEKGRKRKKEKEKKNYQLSYQYQNFREENKGHKKVYSFLSQLILECYAMSAVQKFKTYADFIQNRCQK